MVVRFLLVLLLPSSVMSESEGSSAKRSSRCFSLVTLVLSFFASFAVVVALEVSNSSDDDDDATDWLSLSSSRFIFSDPECGSTILLPGYYVYCIMGCFVL